MKRLDDSYQIIDKAVSHLGSRIMRTYKDRDFTKKPEHKWIAPIEFMDNRRTVFVYKDKKYGQKSSMYNVENMKKYEIVSGVI